MNTFTRTTLSVAISCLASFAAQAGPVHQPPGSNLTFGDVAHGLNVQSATSNPASAAAARAQNPDQSIGGASLSGAAGLEYGNVQEIFDFIDEVARGYAPSEPGSGSGSGTDPGIDIGEIIDAIDPDVREAIEAIGDEIANQAGLLAVIGSEGYGKAWISADVPIVWNTEFLGGTWTTGVNWSGASKAYGVAVPLEFDVDAALVELERWIDDTLGSLDGQVALSDQVLAQSDADRNIIIVLDNDSSLLTKASQLTEFNVGYSRQAIATDNGGLFLGVEGKFYDMRLSRFAARFGDITDSEELFDAIRDAEFNSTTDYGVDIGALWVGRNYQLGVQWTNINEPEFQYPEVDVSPYRSAQAIRFFEEDQTYKMDSQVKVEASLFSTDRRWSAHVGYDVDAAADPFGDDFQWVTVSAALARDSFWLPNFRLGYRQNLAGTELGYVNLGVTAFKYLNIDIGSALDTVKIDGDELPQGVMFSMGFQVNW